MSQSTCGLRPEAEPRFKNKYFEAFFFTSRVAYTVFHHSLDGERKVIKMKKIANTDDLNLHLNSHLVLEGPAAPFSF